MLKCTWSILLCTNANVQILVQTVLGCCIWECWQSQQCCTLSKLKKKDCEVCPDIILMLHCETLKGRVTVCKFMCFTIMMSKSWFSLQQHQVMNVSDVMGDMCFLKSGANLFPLFWKDAPKLPNYMWPTEPPKIDFPYQSAFFQGFLGALRVYICSSFHLHGADHTLKELMTNLCVYVFFV